MTMMTQLDCIDLKDSRPPQTDHGDNQRRTSYRTSRTPQRPILAWHSFIVASALMSYFMASLSCCQSTSIIVLASSSSRIEERCNSKPTKISRLRGIKDATPLAFLGSRHNSKQKDIALLLQDSIRMRLQSLPRMMQPRKKVNHATGALNRYSFNCRSNALSSSSARYMLDFLNRQEKELSTLASTSSSLLELVIKRDTSTNNMHQEDVQTLVLKLIDEGPHFYNPQESLFEGGLWCTLAAFTPNQPRQKKPLWERISLLQDNLKGQQYILNDTNNYFDAVKVNENEIEKSKSNVAGTVINYAEILGNSFHLRAEGYFTPIGIQGSARAEEETKSEQPISLSFLDDFLTSLFKDDKRSNVNSTSNLGNKFLENKVSCPDNYRVTVTKASFCFGDKFSIDIPIQGSSVLSVLYADSNLRVFISPEDTASSGVIGAGAGEWENAGLIVVQVRSDLVSPRKEKVDLRK